MKKEDNTDKMIEIHRPKSKLDVHMVLCVEEQCQGERCPDYMDECASEYN